MQYLIIREYKMYSYVYCYFDVLYTYTVKEFTIRNIENMNFYNT